MMCSDRETQLNEYVDGTLPTRARLAVEEHLAQCPGCRAAVAQLRGLVASARVLPPSLEPARDLWSDVARRLGPRVARGRRTWWREGMFWGGALAAAAVLGIAVGLARLSAPAPRPPGAEWVAVEAGYDRAAEELSHTLEAERRRLAPETIAVVERNLGIIDRALRESRTALARDPANVALRQLFAAAYRQKVELLRWAARVATAG